MRQDKDDANMFGGEQGSTGNSSGFKQFFTFRVVAGIAFGVIVLWGSWIVLSRFGEPPRESSVAKVEEGAVDSSVREADPGAPHVGNASSLEHHLPSKGDFPLGHDTSIEPGVSPEHFVSPRNVPSHEQRAVGVRFVEATASVLDYELNKRFWGWRRNDVIRLTDNVENMQLGVLEVVRRTSVNLVEKMSRLGVSTAIDKNLENAMNWLMIKPERYWLPSAEEKYNDSLKELRVYARKLETGDAHFYTRTDNLIPLLLSFADLAGSCDDNLVKLEEEDGSPVSWFKTDDYFYYAKGIARAMEEILLAVREDFSSVLEGRNGVDLLHRTIHSCHVAGKLDPWVVTDAPLDGILANHRANMAAEISHARYFLNALAKALST